MTAQRQLLCGILTQILAISCWFNAAAIVPGIASEYSLDANQTGILTAGVQVGFAVGALVLGILRITDRVRPSILIFWGALATAVFTTVPILLGGFPVLAASRFAVGLALAAVYPTGMRAVLSWAPARTRGLAVAALVSAMALGTAAPHLIAGSAPDEWRLVMLITGVLALAAAMLGLAARTGPHIAPVQPVSMAGLVAMLRDRVQRRISIAYVGHMWEVYGLWVWLPSLLLLLPAFGGLESPAGAVGFWSFAIIGIAGVVGCVLSGVLPHWFGKRRVARVTSAVSGLALLTVPFIQAWPTWVALAILALWSAAAIGDSALYSAMTGDESGSGAVGTAIVVQMAVGYAVSVGAIYAVPLMADLVGWKFAVLVLMVGPIASTIAMRPWEQRFR